jgi:hypothetical protein
MRVPFDSISLLAQSSAASSLGTGRVRRVVPVTPCTPDFLDCGGSHHPAIRCAYSGWSVCVFRASYAAREGDLEHTFHYHPYFKEQKEKKSFIRVVSEPLAPWIYCSTYRHIASWYAYPVALQLLPIDCKVISKSST